MPMTATEGSGKKGGLFAVTRGQFGEKARCSLRGCVRRAGYAAVQGPGQSTLIEFTSPKGWGRLTVVQTDTVDLDEPTAGGRSHLGSEAGL